MPKPRPDYERRPHQNFTPLAEPRAQLFKRLMAAGILKPIVPKPIPKWFEGAKYCAYHSGASTHDTESCVSLKHKIQDLTNVKAIQLSLSNGNNPVPYQGNIAINMIATEEEWNHQVDIDFSLPKPISMSDQSFTMQVQEEVFNDDVLVKGVEKLFITAIDKEDMILKMALRPQPFGKPNQR
ncbi:hypothetical protein A4A49_54378 [Nicotiana attenuata]|uniref:Uncharacterized protein n=1 Tax=Nicotiana attenuata TaxID=49451 RepID=A0A314KMY6_NICAT|nr:hypothetical protein A4A49_54378 [Nicotiana attenuata]